MGRTNGLFFTQLDTQPKDEDQSINSSNSFCSRTHVGLNDDFFGSIYNRRGEKNSCEKHNTKESIRIPNLKQKQKIQILKISD